ncbi:sugar transferase [Amycolatopsis panacis]|uniref:Sugar transferase n=1 Tax=Amycolatopsis panacis TaxID=2340917 RepID=A0A419I4T0_9PSEU|nr:sugar transferase [Amycolatopsis panacis]RJQ85468.1 sugar transferase [Amycolatopsis panacis]
MTHIVADSAKRRGCDIVVAVAALILLLPFLVVIAVGIRLTSPGPAIYRQRRMGRDTHPFTIWKFRTMVANADRIGPAVSGGRDARITTMGRWLRRMRLDELPQLVNLARGDMTLIGPRPEVGKFLGYYTPAERRLFAVRPGILGPGALLFAAEQSRELTAADDPESCYVTHHLHAKLALDLAYLERRGLRADLDLLARTARLLCRPAGVR